MLILATLLALAALVGGCSLTLDTVECESDEQCQALAAEGQRLVCGDDNTCVEVAGGCFVHSDCPGATNICTPSGVCAEALSGTCDTLVTQVDQGATINDDTVIIGSMLPLTFGGGSLGYMAEALRLAVGQVNADGGLIGNRQIAVVLCNPEPENDIAESWNTVAEHLTATLEVPLIIGPAFSGISSTVHPIANAAGTVLISPSATSPSLTAIDEGADPDRDIFWRTVPSDVQQAEGLAALIATRDYEPVLVFYKEDAYGEGLQSIIEARLQASGADFEQRGYRADANLDALIPTASAEFRDTTGDPYEAIVFLSTAEGADLALYWEEQVIAYNADNPDAMIEPPVYVFSEGSKDQILQALTGDNNLSDEQLRALLTRIEGTQPDTRNPADDFQPYDIFSGVFRSRFGADPGLYASTTYDAVYAAFLAMCTIPTDQPITREGLIAGFSRLTSGDAWTPEGIASEKNERCITLNNGGAIDLEGASGSLQFDDRGDVPASGFTLWTIENTAADPTTAIELNYNNTAGVFAQGSWTFEATGEPAP